MSGGVIMNAITTANLLFLTTQVLGAASPPIYHTLPPLPYAYDALEPYIDTETMRLHHDKHHQVYLDKLNAALVPYPELHKRSLEYLVTHLDKLPEAIRTVVRNNAGGALNHTMFWLWLTPTSTKPTGALLAALDKTFGSLESFKNQFDEAAKTVFGSGWAWLVMDGSGTLSITTSKDQDSPLSRGLTPLLGLDVWEHAYYLKYQNKRPEYIKAWWHVVNWAQVEKLYVAACKKATPMVSGTFIIPGVTGDLAKRKIIPALYDLVKKGFRGLIVGTGRRADISVSELVVGSREFIDGYDEAIGKKLTELMLYEKLDPESLDDFNNLGAVILDHEHRKELSGSRIVYLSIPPESFCEMTKNLVAGGVITSGNPKHRIGYEKPFGWDIASAIDIDKCISQELAPAQIYRVDHFLTKTIIATLPFILSTNAVLADSFNKNAIESVSVYINEKIGIEGRGSFYENVGALKDIVQNHLLQLLMRVAVISKKQLTRQEASKRAVELLAKTEIVDGVLGQYEGYHNEKGVNENSTTETFVGLKLKVNDPQWAGVPFYIQTGKKLGDKLTQVNVQFKQHYCGPGSALTITIAPIERIALSLYAKSNSNVGTISLASEPAPVKSIQGYEMVLTDLALGRHEADVSFAEIEEQWRFVKKVHKKKLPLVIYKPGSDGPPQARKLAMSETSLPFCAHPHR